MTPNGQKSGARRQTRRLLVLVATKAGISGLVLALGFRALSDDDHARVVIAQSFAHAPRLDPSGSSWLPFPFWLQGGLMMLFGRSLLVARITAFLLGLLSALATYVGGRWVGASPRGALLGTLLACALPHAAWLGVATVPDGPVAALLWLGAGALASGQTRRLVLGSLGLLAATLSRYEAWPIAAGFSICCGCESVRRRSLRELLPATLALLGPIAWMIHGRLAHGSAIFFLERVTGYRQALGTARHSLVEALLLYPLGLFRHQPELFALLALVLITAHHGYELGQARRYQRPALLGLLLLGFLSAGELSGGGATHHTERTLLAIWLGAAVLTGDLLERCWDRFTPRARWQVLSASGVLVVGVATGLRPVLVPSASFAPRFEEIDLGQRAGLRAEQWPGRLLVATDDYGYWAVIAAFSRPERAIVADDHDPRHARPRDPFVSELELRQRMVQEDLRWVVASRRHSMLLRRMGVKLAETRRFVLVETRPQMYQHFPGR